MAAIFELAEGPALITVGRIRTGIPASASRTLADRFSISQNELASKLRVTTRTLPRLAAEHNPLPPDITERVLRAARVMAKARVILSDDRSIVTCLNMETPSLNGEKPIDLPDTDVGAGEVEGLILGLAYGNLK